MNPSTDLVNRLWRLCAVLRKDGITYPQYVAELTYLLFLKMLKETGSEDGRVPPALRWSRLSSSPKDSSLATYRQILTDLAENRDVDPAIRAIFNGSATVIRDANNLDLLISAIDQIPWFSEGRDSFGDLYEGLLQKNAEETKRGAGQYFTPRVIVDVIMEVVKPQSGEVVQDPAAGTGGFLVAANRFVRHREPSSAGAIVCAGMENVKETYRLLLMNLYLHGISAQDVHVGDTLSDDAKALLPPDLILTNPPFGPAGGRPTRDDLVITSSVSSYQLPFVEHCIRTLKPGGRAAIVIPDNVLFEEGRGRALRQYMMKECNAHTILRLPTGIFYAQGVKTNVLFLQKNHAGLSGTDEIWIYDLRTGMPAFGRNTPLTYAHFSDFITSYGAEVNGAGKRIEGDIDSRFRRFSRAEIAARGENLDITWLRDPDDDPDADLTEPEDLTAAIVGHLRSALAELESIAEEVEQEEVANLVGLR